MLSVHASEFFPPSFSSSSVPVLNKEGDDNGIIATVIKPKKTKEMRGPRKRNRKKKSGFVADSHEDDTISYLSLETSDTAFNNLDYTDNYYNTNNGTYNHDKAVPQTSRNDIDPLTKFDRKTYSVYNIAGDNYPICIYINVFTYSSLYIYIYIHIYICIYIYVCFL
jgi:hypothetical protein